MSALPASAAGTVRPRTKPLALSERCLLLQELNSLHFLSAALLLQAGAFYNMRVLPQHSLLLRQKHVWAQNALSQPCHASAARAFCNTQVLCQHCLLLQPGVELNPLHILSAALILQPGHSITRKCILCAACFCSRNMFGSRTKPVALSQCCRASAAGAFCNAQVLCQHCLLLQPGVELNFALSKRCVVSAVGDFYTRWLRLFFPQFLGEHVQAATLENSWPSCTSTSAWSAGKHSLQQALDHSSSQEGRTCSHFTLDDPR